MTLPVKDQVAHFDRLARIAMIGLCVFGGVQLVLVFTTIASGWVGALAVLNLALLALRIRWLYRQERARILNDSAASFLYLAQSGWQPRPWDDWW